MAATVDSLFGFAATAGIVSDWMFEAVAESFAAGDAGEFLRRANPWALNSIVERLLEAEQRRLWAAKPQTLAALRAELLFSEATIEGHAEVRIDAMAGGSEVAGHGRAEYEAHERIGER
jgi:cobaltochelatase CobN